MAKRLLLIGWDAADWTMLNPLLDAGELPALRGLVEGGIVGGLLAGQPLDAASQWTSIVTGKRPWQHGITVSNEPDARDQRPLPISRAHRCSTALWEMLARHGQRGIVIGWPATHGSQSDLVATVSNRYSEPTAPPGVKPWPAARPGTYWPEALKHRLDGLRASPEDIGADIIARYIPSWREIDQQRDRRLGRLRVLLTLDFSNYAAATALLGQAEWDFAAVRFPAFWHLARLFLMFHLPGYPEVNPSELNLYHGVLRSHCQTLDQMLAALRRQVGPDSAVVVVSAHGLHLPRGVPARNQSRDDEAWKSPLGMIAGAGPGFAADQLLQGATTLDVTPTLLAWFGLPLGEDMEGRVLLEGFDPAPEIRRIPTWDADTPASRSTVTIWASASPQGLQAEWNFVQSCFEAGRLQEALPRLEALVRAFPERPDFCHSLFQCQLGLGQVAQAETTLELYLESVPAGPPALLARAELALAQKDLSRARALAAEVRLENPTHRALASRLGLLFLRLREWDALAELAQAALNRDADEPIAWLGLAEASLRRRKSAEAEAAARRAIRLNYYLADAHFVLARAMVAQGKWNEAREAMNALRKLQPQNRAVATYERRLAPNPPSPLQSSAPH